MTVLSISGISKGKILIHTSVKLVTYAFEASTLYPYYFNPHEREARDQSVEGLRADLLHFNPHEREARDCKFCPCYDFCFQF